jgi:hypothetical protein
MKTPANKPELSIQSWPTLTSRRSLAAAMNKESRTRRAWWRLLAGLLFTLPVHTPAAAEDAPPISTMLKEGWQIAGYSQASDNRSTFILFRHPDQAYLVQCRAGYDATRTPPPIRSATGSSESVVSCRAV